MKSRNYIKPCIKTKILTEDTNLMAASFDPTQTTTTIGTNPTDPITDPNQVGAKQWYNSPWDDNGTGGFE